MRDEVGIRGVAEGSEGREGGKTSGERDGVVVSEGEEDDEDGGGLGKRKT